MKIELHGHEKAAGIYAIRNRADGRVYIGETQRFDKRAAHHRRTLGYGTHTNAPMQIDHARGAVLDFEVLAVIDDVETRVAVEKATIGALAGPDCYNVRKGAQPYRRRKWTLGHEARANIARGATGRRHSEATRAKMSVAKKGRPPSVACLEAARRAKLGSTMPAETRAKIGAAHVGKKHPNRRPHPPITEETRAKLRAAMLGNTNGKRKEK